MNTTLKSPLLAMALSLAIASPTFAGGKAEPNIVQFKSGVSTVSVKGKITGNEQFEYAVNAKKGQWFMVEVLSSPLDSAIVGVKTPTGEETYSHYRWGTMVPANGQYQIWTTKPADYKTANFTLKVTLGAPPARLKYTPGDRELAELYGAMRNFINAFRTNNRAAFLASFSRTKPFYQLNPMVVGSKRYYRTAVSYSQLATDINKKQGLYWTYLQRAENGEMDAFIDFFPNSTMWRRTPNNIFVPPDEDIANMTFVKWRKEGTRWVVDEISYAQA